MTACVCFCTCPDAATAQRIADILVEEALAACVNILPGVRSVYRWRGTIQNDDEMLLLIKTTVQRVEPLTERVLALHPYELPEVVAVEVAGGSPAYLDWLSQATQGESALNTRQAGPPPPSGV